jgi:hypothetical protein
MTIVYHLFLYTGILGSTIQPTFQLILNILYTILTFCALVIPFCFSAFYFTDNRYILCMYILVVYSVYFSSIQYFKRKQDKLLFSNFEQECTSSQITMLKVNYFLFHLVGTYCLFGIPVSLYMANSISSIQLSLACIVGLFWFSFYSICCAFYTYVLMFCYGQTSIIKNWLKGLKRGTYPTDIESILQLYQHNYKISKSFRGLWQTTLLIIFSLLGFRIPFGFILVVYGNVYWEIPLLLFYIYAFLQLSVGVCQLNAQNEYFQIYFIKHPHIIQKRDQVDTLIEYNKIRTLGISVYGFHPTFKHLIGLVLLIVNIAIPIGLSFLISNLK